jgi:hypothetical protein
MMDGDWQFNRPHAAVSAVLHLLHLLPTTSLFFYIGVLTVACAARRNLHISLPQLVLAMH